MDLQVHRDTEFHWYMLQTANGFENAVKNTIAQRIAVDKRLQLSINETFVPLMQGETSVRESSVMPSYIFLRMKMDKFLHQMISEIQYVVAFVGGDHGGRSAAGNMLGTRGFVYIMLT